MLSFEEFFTKKKIDLAALRKADEPLFFEFQDHYQKMGEKSFDHSKKFWFNQLRRLHPLAEEDVIPKKESQVVLPTDTIIPDGEQKTVSQREPAIKPAGFKPRFKAPLIKTEDKEEDVDIPASAIPAKPAGFKPRFRPEVTKSASPEVPKNDTSETESEATKTPDPANKPAGFKPRFKAGITKTASEDESKTEFPANENITEKSSGPANKPIGFKPKFKVDNFKTEASSEEVKNESPSTESNIEKTSDSANKPAGFKPRFKSGPTKTNTNQDNNS